MNRYTLQKHISTLWIECKKVDLYCKILKLSINFGFVVHCKKNCCSFIGLTTLIVGMTININLRQATENIDNS